MPFPDFLPVSYCLSSYNQSVTPSTIPQLSLGTLVAVFMRKQKSQITANGHQYFKGEHSDDTRRQV